MADTTTPDSGPDPNDGARSGARLKISNWVFADGTRSWTNFFYDSQRKENCYIDGPWPDGNYYCEPGGSSTEYSDATCATPVGMVYRDPTCPQPPPTYFIQYDYGSACTYGPRHIFMRGTKLATTTYYYKSSNGACNGPVTTTNEDFYAVGAEVALTGLVKLDIGAPVGTGALQERFATATDGFRFPYSVHDSMFGADCYPVAYDPTGVSAQCIPNNSRYASYDHDSSCTTPELSQPKGCVAPQFAEYFPPNSCPNDPPKYWAAGALVTAPPLYYNNGTACVTQTASTTVDYYTTAQQLTLNSLVRAPDMLASHRIQLIHMSTSDGLRVRDYTLYDQQQGVECYPTQLPDGSTRCVPYGGYVDSWFKDSGCTQAIDLLEVTTGPTSCGTTYVPKLGTKYVAPPAGSCTYSQQVHTVGALYSGSVYYGAPGACTLYAPTQTQWYTVNPAVIDPLTFASATAVIDQ